MGSRFLRECAPGGEQRSCRQRQADGGPRAWPAPPQDNGVGLQGGPGPRRRLPAHGCQVQRCAGAGRQDGAQPLPPTLLLLPPPAPSGNFNERLGERSCDPAAAQDFVSLKINRLEDTRASKPTMGAGQGCCCVSPATPPWAPALAAQPHACAKAAPGPASPQIKRSPLELPAQQSSLPLLSLALIHLFV